MHHGDHYIADDPENSARSRRAPIDPQPRRDRLEAAQPIAIGDNVWLAGGVIVCPGVTIGDNTVIGAGGVVTRDIPANVVAVGNPARVIRTLEER